MTIFDELVGSEFHDDLLVAVDYNKALTTLTIEYYDEDDNERSVEVSISGIDHVLREDVLTRGFKMEADDGGIITLKQEGEDVILLLDWCSYSPTVSVTRYYKMFGATILSVTEPTQPTDISNNPA